MTLSTSGYVCLGNCQNLLSDECFGCGDSPRRSDDVLVGWNTNNVYQFQHGQIYFKNLKQDSLDFMSSKIYLNQLNPNYEPTNIFMITYENFKHYEDDIHFDIVSFRIFLSTNYMDKQSYVTFKYNFCAKSQTSAPSGLHLKNNSDFIIPDGKQCSSSNIGQNGVWISEVTNFESGNWPSQLFSSGWAGLAAKWLRVAQSDGKLKF